MVKALRLMQIKETLSHNKIATVNNLSEQLGVSSATIRNDLIQLETEGFLLRTHGGAVLAVNDSINTINDPLPFYDVESRKQKMLSEIGELAAKYIKNDFWNYLGYGSTCREIARHLLSLPIKMVTGNIDASIILSQNKYAKIFIPGGNLDKKDDYLFLSGEWYQKGLNNLNFNQAYISVAGIDESGFTVDNSSECQTLELIRSITKEIVIVSDSNKFGKTSFFRIGSLSFADAVITNNDVSPLYTDILKENGVKLITPSTRKLS